MVLKMSDVARVIILKLSDMTIGFLGCVSYNKMSDVTRINYKDGADYKGKKDLVICRKLYKAWYEESL